MQKSPCAYAVLQRFFALILHEGSVLTNYSIALVNVIPLNKLLRFLETCYGKKTIFVQLFLFVKPDNRVL